MNEIKFNLLKGFSTLIMGIALAFGLPDPSYAANFCVSSVAELQIALSDAQTNGQDDKVQIVQGNYVGNFVYSGLEANDLTIEGGYTVGCASRTVAAANTVLDGHQAGTTLVLISDKKIDFFVEGVTLQNGKSVSDVGGGGLYLKTPEGNITVNHSVIEGNIAEKSGGGIRVVSTDSATFTNNTISGNTASSSPGGGGIYVESGTTIFTNNTITGNTVNRYNGGGVYAKSSATFTGNTITENSAVRGGGAYIEGTATFTSNTITNNTANGEGGGVLVSASSRTVVFTDNTISGNTAQSDGGGVLVGASNGTVTFTNNTVSNNKVIGNNNGGGISVSSSTATFTGNTVSGNTTGQSGGGLYVRSDTITVTNNTINNNTANGNNRDTYGGGGIYAYIYTSKASFTDNTIKGNVAESNGGGIFVLGYSNRSTATFTNNAILGNTANQNGAGIYTTSTKVSTLTNNIISGNTAKTESGGGLRINSNTANLINNTITGNSANLGGGLWLELKENTDLANIYNNIVWSNSAAQGGDLYLVNDGNGDFQRSVVNLYNNDFDQSANGIYLKIAFAIDASNLNNVDPLFVNASNGDYHVPTTSPVIDKGNNLAPERPNTDKDNRPRISNGTVDLGAYEYPSADSEGVLQFTQATYTVDEETGSTLMTVTRTSGSVGAVSVNYATADGTAKAGDDYTAASGTLSWGDGETAPKTFTITVANDGVKEDNETINVTLKNATGGATLGLQETAVLTISASKQYQLNVSQSGTGTGRVTGDGIDCGRDCAEIYEANTQVTLTATPETGSVFAGWTGACSGTDTTCQVTINKVQTVTTTFNLIPTHGLTINKVGTGSGTVTGEGIDCGSDCTETYTETGKVVTLTASADSGSAFVGWGGVCTGTTATCQVTLNNAQNVTATFNLIPVALTVSTTGNGSIIGDGIHCGSDCSETYTHNTTVTLTAQRGAGSTFIGWGEHCAGTETTCQVVMDQARTVTAQFESYYSVTVIKDGTGEGSVVDGEVLDCGEQCDTSYEEGRPVTLVATPADGSVFVSWNGACIGSEPTCAFTMTQNQIVMATFNNQLAADRDACFTFAYDPTTPFMVDVDASCSGDGINDYQWESADGQTAFGQTASFNFEALVDKYAVITLQVTDALNARGKSSQILTFDEAIVFTGVRPLYKVGDLLTIKVVENLSFSRRNERVDLWVAVQLPSGELLFFTPMPSIFSFDPQPLKFVDRGETDHQVLEFVIPPKLGGSYTLYALYVQAGTNPMAETLSRIARSNLAAIKMIFSNH